MKYYFSNKKRSFENIAEVNPKCSALSETSQTGKEPCYGNLLYDVLEKATLKGQRIGLARSWRLRR